MLLIDIACGEPLHANNERKRRQLEKLLQTTRALSGPDMPQIAIRHDGPVRNEEFQRQLSHHCADAESEPPCNDLNLKGMTHKAQNKQIQMKSVAADCRD